jgi:hypothetical protein
MSTSPRIATKLLAAAAATAAAATISISLAPSASAITGGCGGGRPNTAAAVRGGGGCNPFERIENAFDRFFHIPDRDDQQLQQRRAAK